MGVTRLILEITFNNAIIDFVVHLLTLELQFYVQVTLYSLHIIWVQKYVTMSIPPTCTHTHIQLSSFLIAMQHYDE